LSNLYSVAARKDTPFCFFIQVFQHAKAQHLFPEVSFVQFFIQNDFINILQLSKRKLFRQELKSNGLMFDPSFNFFQAFIKDLLMIKCQLRQILYIDPMRLFGVVA
jgi:hypothetical protein